MAPRAFYDSFAYRRSCLCGTQDPGTDKRTLPGQGRAFPGQGRVCGSARAAGRHRRREHTSFRRGPDQEHGAKAALEQQTATSDILRVIGSSPTDLQPVFDTIVQNAKRLLNGHSAAVATLAGEEIHLGAFTTTDEAGDDALKEIRPRTLASVPLLASIGRDLVPRVVSDTETDQRIAPSTRETARVRGFRSLLGVPLVRRGQAIGAITLTRRDAGTFADNEIALIKTFADQAVIAIENARLFEAEQARTRKVEVKSTELARSLEYQTAISEVLGVISRSPNELQPIFNTIVASSKRLLRAHSAVVTPAIVD